MPRTPNARATGNRARGAPARIVAPPTSAAPAMAPSVPIRETAPEVPRGTRNKRSTCTGSLGLRAPTDVAQVSAAAAAREQVTTERPSAGHVRPINPPTAAMPPFAVTCQGSRRFPRASTHGAWRDSVARETALLPAKKAASAAPPGHPVPARTASPTTHAARAPPPVSVRSRQAASETRAARPKATGHWIMSDGNVC